jgi:hypothetical protein
MKKMLPLLAFLLLCAAPSHAQGPCSQVSNCGTQFFYVGVLSGAPASCPTAAVAFMTDQSPNLYACSSSTWVQQTSSGGSMPSGMIGMIVTGSCPSAWTQVAALNGTMLQGTLAANGDVGTTGGSNSITATGTVSQPTFSGASDTTSAVSAGTPAGTNSTAAFTPAGTVAAPTFTGASDTTSAVSAGTPAGVNSATNTVSKLVTSSSGVTLTFVGSALATHTHTVTPTGTNSAPAFTGSSGTVPAETFSGSALATHTHTVTPTGTVSQPSLTMNAFDPHPAFTKVIFCSKN